MILSDKDIRRYIKEGKIKIVPKPNLKKQLGPCSLDLHLGRIFKIFKYTEYPYIDLRNRKTPVDKIMTEVKISKEKPLILRPRDFVLAITEETIELAPDIMGRLDGRSSLGRLGLVVHSTAARFDPGWKGKATMEIGNLGPLPIALYPGIRICAMTFETLSSPAEVPYTKQRDHKYAGQKKPRPSQIHQEDLK